MNRTRLRIGVLVAVVLGGATLAVLAGFALGTPETDIQFENATAEVGVEYVSDELKPGGGNEGVYVADVDRDGWQDFLAVGGERPVLYENVGGEFERSGALASVDRPIKSAVFVDYDGDGWEDLLLLAEYAEPVVFENREGSLERTSIGLGNLSYPLGATSADYDRDGDLDLFVHQSGDWAAGKPNGYFSFTGHVAEDNGNPNVLYENVGGEYERVRGTAIGEANRWSLVASFVDLNGDRYPDLHVANDFNNDTVYVNRGDGTFEERLLPGATARNGMSSEIGDFDGDGHQDVFTTNIEIPISRETMSNERYDRIKRLYQFVIQSHRTEGNTLMVNDGTGNLTDRAPEFGVREGGWGWAASHTDYDNDGDQDLLHATQWVIQVYPDDPVYTYPMLFERDEEGFTRLNASDRGLEQVDGRGLATLDYDRDGDRDVIVAAAQYPIHVYENVGTEGNGLAFRVLADGRFARGATVDVTAGPHSVAVQQTDRADWLSQESRVHHVGTGGEGTATLTVTWPDGTERTFEGVGTDQEIVIRKTGVESVYRYER